MKNNRVVFDINKAQYAWQSWTTLCGNYRSRFKPEVSTVYGQCIDSDAPAFPFSVDFPQETMHERAIRLSILDIWIPCVTFRFAANNQLTFTGDKAEKLWDAWCALQFKRNNRNKKK